jgi:hypothetical protein
VAEVIPSVWAMWHKWDLTTKVIKHKARLNLHGRKQMYGMNYFETYAPVATWFAIRLMIVFGIIFCWDLWQVDFVMAYPQALHRIAPRYQDCDWKLQGPHTEATQEHLWSEASWKSVEFIPHGQAHLIGLYFFVDC